MQEVLITMLISEMASMLAMSRLIPISTGPSTQMTMQLEICHLGKGMRKYGFLCCKLHVKRIPTIEIRSEVAVVSFHQLLDRWQKLRVVPISPVVSRIHAAAEDG